MRTCQAACLCVVMCWRLSGVTYQSPAGMFVSWIQLFVYPRMSKLYFPNSVLPIRVINFHSGRPIEVVHFENIYLYINNFIIDHIAKIPIMNGVKNTITLINDQKRIFLLL